MRGYYQLFSSTHLLRDPKVLVNYETVTFLKRYTDTLFGTWLFVDTRYVRNLSLCYLRVVIHKLLTVSVCNVPQSSLLYSRLFHSTIPFEGQLSTSYIT